MRPLIGVTCSREVGGAWGLYSRGHFMDYVFEEYTRAVQQAGGAPVIIPMTRDPDTLQTIVRRIDGLLLSGGPDINPKLYGEESIPGLGEVDEELDRMELEVASLAFKRNLPILAICRGLQILNVLRGGTLYQDVTSQVQGSLEHTQKADKSTTTHSIQINRNTLLFRILKKTEIWVNGRHHQAVKDLSKGFVISAQAKDGTIEAIEHPSRGFVLGVQWHPEGNWRKDPFSRKLFSALTDAASRRKRN